MQSKPSNKNGAQLIAQQLESLGIKYIFGIPGAKIDRLFDAIEDTNIQMIPVRTKLTAHLWRALWED